MEVSKLGQVRHATKAVGHRSWLGNRWYNYNRVKRLD